MNRPVLFNEQIMSVYGHRIMLRVYPELGSYEMSSETALSSEQKKAILMYLSQEGFLDSCNGGGDGGQRVEA